MTKAKPKCTVGTACGFGCISIEDDCHDLVSKAAASALLKAAKSELAGSKVEYGATAANLVLGNFLPPELAFDADVLSTVVESSLVYMANSVIARARASKQRKLAAA